MSTNLTNQLTVKITLSLLLFFSVSFYCFSQEERTSVIKVNATALAFKTYNIQFEKAFSKRFSFALGVSHRPEERIPFASAVRKYVDAADEGIDYISLENVKKGEATMGLFKITPELRYYIGKKKSAPIGTYISLFGRYERFFGTLPVFVDVVYKGQDLRVELPVKTEFKTTSGGLMLGRQFRLGERFTLDWYIIGGYFGNVKVHGESRQNLEQYDDQFINDLKENIKDTFKINEDYLSLEVDKQGVRIDNARRLKYANLRGFGFNLGYRF